MGAVSLDYREYPHTAPAWPQDISSSAHHATRQVTTMEYVGLCAKIVHTATTNIFFGAAAYVNIVETPARKSLKSADAVIDHFQASFPRAANMMKPLAAAGFLSGLLAWYMESSAERSWLLCSSIGMFFMFPWTILVIAPTNKLLMDGDNPKKKGDSWVQEMMTKWDRVHGVRTLVCFGAAASLMTFW